MSSPAKSQRLVSLTGAPRYQPATQVHQRAQTRKIRAD